MPPRPLIRAAEIRRRVRELGREISAAHADRAPLLLLLMDGAFCFAADLAREIASPEARLAFLRVRSSGAGTESSGRVEMEALPELAGAHVVVVDDILDSGRTLAAVRAAALAAGSASVSTCVLLDKPSRRVPEGLARADHSGFTVPEAFLVGYGLDLDGRWRHLRDVCVLEP